MGVRGLKMFCRGGGQNFFFLLCVCGGGGCQVQYLSFREKKTSLLLINDWYLQQKVPRVATSLIFFKILLGSNTSSCNFVECT